jgi:Tol biopolymer transport system component
MSADGKQLYYSQAPNVSGLVPAKLMAHDLVSGDKRVVTELTTRGSGLFSISVSPDGSLIAFVILDAEGKTRLVVVPSVGGPPRNLAIGATTFGSTAWTKDGRYILYVDLSAQIMAVPVAGGAPERVGSAMDRVQSLAVHPDGTRLAFVGINEAADLWIARGIADARE